MKKTIFFITREIVPFYYGGIGTLFMSIAKYFEKLGHNVYFLSCPQEDFEQKEYEKYYGSIPILFAQDKIEENFIDYSPSGGLVNSFNLAYSYSVAKLYDSVVQKIHPDLVFSADYGAESFVLILRNSLGFYPETRFITHLSGSLKEVLTVYQEGVGKDVGDELHEPRNRLTCLMEDTSMLLSDEIISPSNSAWNQLSNRLELRNKRVQVIPNLMEHKFRAIEFEKKISENKRYNQILFIGRLDHHKGADILLKLYLEYIDRYDDHSKLVFVGRDCFCKEYGQTFLEEWIDLIPDHLKDRIKFVGQIDHKQVEHYLQNAAVCIFPSRWEVFGIVCLEAMVYGVPTLVTKDTGLAELLGNELKDFSFDFKTAKEAFLTKLHDILSSKDNNFALRRKFRRRAFEVLDKGDQGYRDILDQECLENIKELSSDIVNNLITSLSVMSDISEYLCYDFNTLKSHYNVSDDEVKKIIQKGDKAKSESVFKKIRSYIFF